MNKADGSLRLHLAEPDPIVTPLDVAEGLKYWRELNATPNKWARFTASQFTYNRVVCVEWGHKYENGFKERSVGTVIFTLEGGKVYVTRHTHS